MKRTTLLYAALIIVLAAVSVWLMKETDEESTLKDLREEYRFYVEDTAAVDQIILYDKTPSRVELTRTANGWMVDGQYPAREDAVETLLLTLNRMQMRNFIPDRMQETVIKRMSVYGKTVEIYANGKLIRTIIVGTDTPDEMGTYMMIKGANAPYAVHIPGFNGFLSTRFFTEPWLWYKRIITDFNPADIQKVSMVYPDSAINSFTLEAESGDNFRLTSEAFPNGIRVAPARAKQFLVAAASMRYEGAIIPSDAIFARKDSLLASSPVFNLTVETADETVNLKAFRIKGPAESIDPDTEAPEFDPDRLHAIVNDDRMILVQYYGLRRVLVTPEYFTLP